MNHIYHLPEHQTLRDQMQRRLAPVLEPRIGHAVIRSICAPQARSFSSTRS